MCTWSPSRSHETPRIIDAPTVAQVDPGLEGDISSQSLDAFGLSTLNPNQLQNSCVSVTIAKLLAFRDVHHFWRDTIGGDLPDAVLTLDDIQELLRRTRWQFRWRAYKPEAGKSAYSLLVKDMYKDVYAFKPDTGILWGTLYSRDGRPGHCVVSGPLANVGSLPRPTHKSLDTHMFTCYQFDTYGVNVEHEVQAADKLLLFFLYCPREAPQWKEYRDRSFWRMIERREDPLWQERWLETVNRSLAVLGVEPITTFPAGDGAGYRNGTPGFQLLSRLTAILASARC
ncbi:unnamed protein product [Clonostachys rosea]|uniref:Uncharacterized protein n=1 Tax=Bionectria ochroleuca TaxID=29856 RepID=A0ABY6U2X9_BIOOC|nr:unnamed protein product [Clonostachys rosea]